jgi:long-chain acyl-CoA synthetase
MLSASAPIDVEVLNFLKICFCCQIREGYGLTEVSGGVTATSLADPLSGHVGGPAEAVRLRIRDVPEMNYFSSDKPYPRGELCIKGPSVFSGYFMRPDKTAEAFDKEGWFLSGDVV